MAAGSIIIDLLMRTGAFETDTGRAEKRLKQFKKEAIDVGKAIGLAFTGFATAGAALVKGSIDAADALTDLAQSTGVSVESLSALTFAADFGAVSQETLGASLVKLTKNMSDAAQGTGEAQKGFEALGISVTNADGSLKAADAALVEIAGKFAGMEDGAEKTALAVNLFGKSGAELIPVLNLGADGIEALKKEAADLGLVIGTDAANAAGEFNDTLARLQGVASGLFNRIAQQLLPTLVNLSASLLDSAKNSGLLDQAARAAATGVKFLLSAGVVVGAAFKALGEALGGVAAALVALFSGRFTDAFNIAKSVTADFVGNIKGAAGTVAGIWDDSASKIASSADGTSSKIAAPVIRAVDKVKAAGKSIKDEAKKIFEDIERQIASINRQVATFGKSETEVALFDLKAGGATAGQLDRAGSALRELDALKAQQEAADKAKEKLKELESQGRASFEATRSPLEALNIELARQQEILNALGPTYFDTYARATDAAQTAYEETLKLSTELDDFSKEAAKNIQGAIGQGLVDILEGNFKDIGRNFLSLINRMVAEAAAAQIARSLFGGLVGGAGEGIFGGVLKGIGSALGFGGAKAGGGDVMPGRSYLVGEEGPERFVPRTMGTIVPTAALAAGGGGTNVTNNFSVTGPVDRRTEAQIAKAATRGLQRAQRWM